MSTKNADLKTASSQKRRAMGQALSSSMNAEKDSFQARLQKAEQTFEAPATEIQPTPRKAKRAKAEIAAPPQALVVRDAFTMPEGDYSLIEQTRRRCLYNAVTITKSQALRAGLQALSQMSDKQLLQAIEQLETVRVGRPKIANPE